MDSLVLNFPLTLSETLNWLSPLPILMHTRFDGDHSVSIGVTSLFPALWDLGPCQ